MFINEFAEFAGSDFLGVTAIIDLFSNSIALRQITGEPKGLLMKAALTASPVHPLVAEFACGMCTNSPTARNVSTGLS